MLSLNHRKSLLLVGLLFIAFKISVVSLYAYVALSVLNPNLKPYCSVLNILHLVRCFKILLCIHDSNSFENDVKSDTGLYLDTSHLSSFLCSGFITVYFNLSGNTPQNRILLHM